MLLGGLFAAREDPKQQFVPPEWAQDAWGPVVRVATAFGIVTLRPGETPTNPHATFLRASKVRDRCAYCGVKPAGPMADLCRCCGAPL